MTKNIALILVSVLGEDICSPQPKIDTKKWPKVNSTPNAFTILLSSGPVYSDVLCKILFASLVMTGPKVWTTTVDYLTVL